MRASIHPYRPRLLIGADVLIDRDQFLRIGIAFFPDPYAQWSPVDVAHGVDLALVFGQRVPGRVPTEGELASLRVDRESEVIHQRGSGAAFEAVFLPRWRPVAGEVELGIGRGRRQQCGNDDERREQCTATS